MADTNHPTIDVATFKGLHNRLDPLRLTFDWLTQADNVDFDSSGKPSVRPGRTLVASGAFTGGYATYDRQRMYALDAGALKSLLRPAVPAVLRTGFVGRPYWVEVNGEVFVGNKNQIWRVSRDGTVSDLAIPRALAPKVTVQSGSLPAGVYRVIVCQLVGDREGPPSDEVQVSAPAGSALAISGLTGNSRIYICPANATVFQHFADAGQSAAVYASPATHLGAELLTDGLDAMSAGDCLTMWSGRLTAALYDPTLDQSVIWTSMPLWWHLADLEEGMFGVPGEVRMLMGHKDGLVIGTDRNIWSYQDGALTRLAEYGVAPGWPGVYDEQRNVYFWTQRGPCSALPFTELVRDQFSSPLQSVVSAALLRRAGEVRLVAGLGGARPPDNAQS